MTDLNITSLKINWFTKMAKPQVNHIKAVLDKFYTDKIDLSDYEKKPEQERQTVFYSRGLAAYYLHVMADISIDLSANSVTDGYGDNGIDALYYDEQTSILHLIQSKMISDGVGEPDNGEMLKFKQGVIDLIDEKFEDFNSKVKSKEQDVKDALGERAIKLNIVLAYTGKGFSAPNEKAKEDLMARLNDTISWAYFTDFNLKNIHSTLSAATSSKPIDHDLTISNWGAIDEPFKTYYGQISAYELASIYLTHGKRLFDENIRSFIGQSAINEEIQNTIKNEPQNFIYFNNGVTIICNEIDPIPGKTVNKNTGGFHCKGIQVINGAQTVGSLGTAFGTYSEQLKLCSVFLRLIPLNICPENFGNKITVASNTQNKIEKRDFVSLDILQHNLRTELALSGITYHYKRTDDVIIYDDKNCSLEEATVALSCWNEDINTAVLAKREIGKLWDDIKLPPYTTIFSEALKGHVMWNTIKVYREVGKFLNEAKTEKTGKEKSTYTYGNYFVLHVLFRIIDKDKIMNPLSDLDAYIKSTPFHTLITQIITISYTQSDIHYSTSLIHQLYRNYTKSKDLKEKVLNLYQTALDGES